MPNTPLEADHNRLADTETQIRLALHIDSDSSLSTLNPDGAQAQESLNSYECPVLTLPSELVSEIFIHFLPTYPLCPPLIGIDSPTSLTHICRDWREIALATPQLWRAIGLFHSDIPFEQQCHIIDIWLNRSRSCPLFIHIENNHAWTELFSVFLPLLSRWEYLKLHCVLLHPVVAALPLLRHLDLSGDDYTTFAFHDVPLLCTAVLNNFAMEVITLPWAQLTSLTLRDVYPFECLPILKQTSNLVHCELCLWIDELSPTDINAPDIMLPCLESLTFRNPDGRRLSDFLAIIVVPALLSLRVPERLLGSDPIGLLMSLISKSGCKLQEMAIHPDGTLTVTEDSYRSAFLSIPQLSFVEQL
ncbi:hypothetical protein B0H19DRAFT_144317 [Mycena capillaripes]|nr:hypothetical protein B0H19DRAFT_144317 [Mycena capillaripes]